MVKIILISLVSAIPIQGMADTITNDAGDITTVQWLLNISFGLIGVLGGWLIHLLHESIRDLQSMDADLTDKIHTIEVLVAGQYVKKDELEKLSDALFSKLDRIEQKLDHKVDRV